MRDVEPAVAQRRLDPELCFADYGVWETHGAKRGLVRALQVYFDTNQQPLDSADGPGPGDCKQPSRAGAPAGGGIGIGTWSRSHKNTDGIPGVFFPLRPRMWITHRGGAVLRGIAASAIRTGYDSGSAGLRRAVSGANHPIRSPHRENWPEAGSPAASRLLLRFMDFFTLLTAAGAGVLSFLSPCVLPLVPGVYLLRLGASLSELAGRGAHRDAVARRRRVIVNTVAFVLGFSIRVRGDGRFGNLCRAVARRKPDHARPDRRDGHRGVRPARDGGFEDPLPQRGKSAFIRAASPSACSARSGSVSRSRLGGRPVSDRSSPAFWCWPRTMRR